MQTESSVSWENYARKYDMLLHYNPFYQELHQEVIEATQNWQINSGDLIADVGAGTGNYSIALAKQFPQASIFHIDNDPGMNAMTVEKREKEGVSNHNILDQGIETVGLAKESLRALVSIHALYTFPNPDEALQKMYDWLEPGGQAILVDAGRIVKVLDWQMAISWRLIRKYGFRKTMEIFREGKEVSYQNARIRELQRNGTFWLHSHEEFCDAVRQAGFNIQESKRSFRGISDFVVVTK